MLASPTSPPPAGIILYTYLLFDNPGAIVTAVLIGVGIVFCGAAVVHNVFVWQRVRKNNRKLQKKNHFYFTVNPGLQYSMYRFLSVRIFPDFFLSENV